MSVCPNENWETNSYSTENGLVVVGFHAAADSIDRSLYPFCARVIIPIKSPNAHGGPTREEAQVLWDMEDRLVAELDASSIPCMLLGRLTHGGVRELVFQVAEYDSFRPPVGAWMEDHNCYEIDVSEHDGWEFFDEFVWPSEKAWIFIMDRRVVNNLVNSGSDSSKIHSLEFVFRGEPHCLRLMRSELVARNYIPLDHSSDESCLVMAFSTPLNLDLIFQESLVLHDLSKRIGCEYDGWGASTVC